MTSSISDEGGYWQLVPVDLTQEHIDQAGRGDVSRSPVALAIADALGVRSIGLRKANADDDTWWWIKSYFFDWNGRTTCVPAKAHWILSCWEIGPGVGRLWTRKPQTGEDGKPLKDEAGNILWTRKAYTWEQLIRPQQFRIRIWIATESETTTHRGQKAA